MKNYTITGFMLIVFIAVSMVVGQPPHQINYQGHLTDNGTAVNGNRQMTFRIYDTMSGGTVLWEETYASVAVFNGLFNVSLGSINPIQLVFDQPCWLAIQVGAGPEMTPRISLNNVGNSYYSFKADSAFKVRDRVITTTKIADGAVTQNKLAPGISLPPGGSAGGDLSGSFPNPVVAQLQGQAVSSVTPGTNQVLKWNGSSWGPGTDDSGGPPSGTASGDLTGSYPDPVVARLQGQAVSSVTPGTNQVLKWNGSSWGPGTDDSGGPPSGSAGGALTGTYPNPGIADGVVSGAKITNETISDIDISPAAAISPGKINGTAWTSFNHGPGSGLHADLLDGQHASSFLNTGSDFGRSGVAANLFEGTSTLTSRYVNENQTNSITSSMIVNGTIVGSDVSSATDLTINDLIASGYIRAGTPSSGYTAGDIVATDDLIADDDIISGSYVYGVGASFGSSTLGDGGSYVYEGDGTLVTVAATNVNSGGYMDVRAGDGSESVRLTTEGTGTSERGWFNVNDPTGNQRFIVSASTGGTGYAHTYGPSGYANAGMTSLSGYPNNGYITVYDGSGVNQAGMYVNSSGQGIVFGDTKSFRMAHPTLPGSEIWYACPEGPEAAAYIRGTGQLINGTVSINFPEHFDAVAGTAGLTVQITPLSAESKGLAVTQKTTIGMTVVELNSGTGNYEFDYMVMAVRKGHENFKVVRSAAELESQSQVPDQAPNKVVIRESENSESDQNTE